MGVWVAFVQELPAWIMVSIGFYIAYRGLKFPDLTVDASFVTGTAAAACAAVHFHSSGLGLLLAVALGAIAGAATTGIYLCNPRPAYKLLAGVLVLFAFYSVNYRVLGFRISQGFVNEPTFMNRLANFEATHSMGTLRPITLLVGLSLVGAQIAFFLWLFHTKLGLVLRSIGSRPHLVSRPNRGVWMYLMLGLVLSNVIVAMGGWYYASINSYSSIGVFGTIIHALAAAIIGEIVFERLPFGRDRRSSISALLAAPIIGACLYQIVRSSVTWFLTNEMTFPGRGDVSINLQDANTVVAVFLVILILVVRLATFKWQYELLNDDGDGGGRIA